MAACAVGLLYAAVSVYWGLGGTWLLDTVGGSLERLGRAGNASVTLALWAAVVLKLVASALPLMAVRGLKDPVRDRAVWILSVIEAAVLIVYGLVWTLVGQLVQIGVVHASANSDHRAERWHAYLWDPWFLLWGLLVAVALGRSGANPG